MIRRFVVAALVIGITSPTSAQLISVRSVSINRSHQFDFIPSFARAFGDLSIAVDDSLADAFINPAKGARTTGARLFSAPALFRVSNGAGDGATLPLGALGRSGRWFGSVAVAMQTVDLSDWGQLGQPLSCFGCENLESSSSSRGNHFVQATLGRVFERGWAFGASVSSSSLQWLHGAEQLYMGSSHIGQRGEIVDVRLGAIREWSGRSIAAVLAHNRYSGSQDVVFLDTIWNPGLQQFDARPRVESNLDQTRVWGGHLQYTQAMKAPGWRVGAIITGNLMSHPKIPNYVLQNIPRDPGHSQAFNVGLGLSKQGHSSTFGIEYVHEPIWSHTWADAASAVTTPRGVVIPVGGKTVDNRFRYSNNQFRIGARNILAVGSRGDEVSLSLGLAVHDIRYSMTQRDLVAGTSRRMHSGWTEWTPTWGLSFRGAGFEFRYRGRVTGAQLGDIFGVRGDDVTVLDPGPSIAAAPSAPLGGFPTVVSLHQFAIVVPIR